MEISYNESDDSADVSQNRGTYQISAELKNIWKHFPGVIANKGIDLELHAGEVHALLGENGAGKTTLMNILSGLYRPDAGTIIINNQSMLFRSPAQAIAAGIGMIHQQFRLVEKLSAAENIHLGWAETPWNAPMVTLSKRTENICSEFGLHVDPHAKIWQLSTGEQQRVEILRVLARGAWILILDEPTAVLTPIEAIELFRVLRTLAVSGRIVVFISHKLDEVLEVSDRITVLRDGRKIATRKTYECDQRSLARLMIGEDVIFQKHTKEDLEGRKILELRNARADNDRGLVALKNTSLHINEGEILGIAGVAGNGQRELAEILTGLRSLKEGKIFIDGEEITDPSPSRLAQSGVGHIPEDRIGMGLIPGESVTHNAILREYKLPPISRGSRIDNHEATNFMKLLVKQAVVRIPSLKVPVRNLSGGNQQRLLVGRETRIASKLLVAVHPTRGLDVGATEEVREVIVKHRNEGSGVLLISEDLDEILALSDRIVVMFEGHIVGEVDAENANREEIGLLMGGATLSANSFRVYDKE